MAGLSFARLLRSTDVSADPVLLAFMKWASGDAAAAGAGALGAGRAVAGDVLGKALGPADVASK
jgi:hypothetical protein